MKALVLLLLSFALLGGSSAAAARLTVSAAWSRPAIGTGVAYATIRNEGATSDRLIGAASPVARAVELHETTEGTATMDGRRMSGVMSMHRVASVAIPPHGSLTLGPGGYHIMLIGLHHELRANETFPLRLHFARTGWLTTIVHVRPM